jgi:hypothetical protein
LNNASHRGLTVVTIVTMIFAPLLVDHHWLYNLVSVHTQTTTVPCVAHRPCPAEQTVVNRVRPPLPPDPADDGQHESDGGNSVKPPVPPDPSGGGHHEGNGGKSVKPPLPPSGGGSSEGNGRKGHQPR